MKKTIIVILTAMLALLQGPAMVYSQTETVFRGDNLPVNDVITVAAEEGEDISWELDEALAEAAEWATDEQPVTVRVTEGEYELGANLHIFSNTILDVRNVTLRCTSESGVNMLMSGTSGYYGNQWDYNQSEACRGYNGFRNITVLGGTWIGSEDNESTLIRIAHASNVTLDGVTVQGGGCAHQIEVAAIDGFYVKNCVFRDLKELGAGNTDKQEALQLDIPCSQSVYPGYRSDGTVMRNVEVTGCQFVNVPRGVGTHTLLRGAYHENITISGNSFENIKEEAIVGLNYYNCKIVDNTIKNCGAGILFQYCKKDPKSIYTQPEQDTDAAGKVRHDAKTVISGNEIQTSYFSSCDEVQGIKLYGRVVSQNEKDALGKTIPAGNYYISGVKVVNNVITTAGHGIHLMDVRACEISGNQIRGAGFSGQDPRKGNYDGIFTEYGYGYKDTKTSLKKNVISGMPRNGILVQNQAFPGTISENKISSCGSDGINFYGSSGCSGNVTGNTISKCRHGIFVHTKASVEANVEKNTISNVKGSGIYITDQSKVRGGLNSNKITSAGEKGIYVNDNSCKSTVGKIQKNTISATKSQSINIASIANHLTIAENKLSGTSDNLLLVQPKTTAYTITIRNNTITGKGKRAAIRVVKGKISIRDNSISAVENGIFADKGVQGSIYYNKFGSKVGSQLKIDRTRRKQISGTVNPQSVKSSAKKKITVTWKKASKASGYEVRYSLKKDFSSGVTAKTAKSSQTSLTASGLTAKKTYYVRVYSYEKVGSIKIFSKNGSVKPVKVKG